jgi:hypothetical protein
MFSRPRPRPVQLSDVYIGSHKTDTNEQGEQELRPDHCLPIALLVAPLFGVRLWGSTAIALLVAPLFGVRLWGSTATAP